MPPRPTRNSGQTANPARLEDARDDFESFDVLEYDVRDRDQRKNQIKFVTNGQASDKTDEINREVRSELPSSSPEAWTVESYRRLADFYKKTANSYAREALAFHDYTTLLEDESDKQHSQITDLKAVNDDLRDSRHYERREAIRWKAKWADLKDKEAEREETPATIRGERQSSAAPSHLSGQTGMSLTSQPRGIRIKDPPQFAGKDDYKVGDWVFDMRNKLTRNPWDFDSSELRVAYTARLVGGDARDHIRDRLDPDSAFPITDPEEIFTILRQVYGKSRETERQEARAEYKGLYQHGTPFPTFWANFNRLTAKLGKSPADQYEDMLERINLDLLKDLGDKKFDTTLQLAEWCMEAENRIALIQKRQTREDRRNRTTSTPRSKVTTYTDKKDYAPTRTTSPFRRSEPIRREVQKQVTFKPSSPTELTCFGCGEVGHLKRDCPNRTKINNLEAESDFDEYDLSDKTSSDDESNTSGNVLL